MDRILENHGNVLFEDDYYYKSIRNAWGLWGCLLLFGGIVLGLGIWLVSYDIGYISQPGLLTICVQIISGLFCIYVRRTFNKFRIYEDGISFTAHKNIPFLPFEQIDNIIKYGENVIIINIKPSHMNQSLKIGSKTYKPRVNDIVGNWAQFIELLEMRLKQTYSGQEARGHFHEISDGQLKRGVE